jgi:hypothetical protein
MGSPGLQGSHPLTFITLSRNNHTIMHLRHTAAFTLTIPEPFDFALTVAKPAG